MYVQKFFDDDDGDLLDLAHALRAYSRWRNQTFVSVTDTINFSPVISGQNDPNPNKNSAQNDQIEEKTRSESTVSQQEMDTTTATNDSPADSAVHPITLGKKELSALMRFSRLLLTHHLPLVMLKWPSCTGESREAMAKELLTRWVT